MNKPLIFQPTLMGIWAETPSLFNLFVLKFQTVLVSFRPPFKHRLVHEQTNNSSLQNQKIPRRFSDLASAVSKDTVKKKINAHRMHRERYVNQIFQNLLP